MRVVGDERFAFVYELHEGARGHDAWRWMFGRFCLRVAGERVGDYEAGCSLGVAIRALSSLLAVGSRRNAALGRLPPEEALRVATRGLFEDYGQSDERVRADEREYRPLWALPSVDIFDGWVAFLVEGTADATFVWQRPDGEIRSIGLAIGEFETVVRTCMDELAALQATLRDE